MHEYSNDSLRGSNLCVSFSGLANDHTKESFELKHELDGKMFPCHFIKIGEFRGSLNTTLRCKCNCNYKM